MKAKNPKTTAFLNETEKLNFQAIPPWLEEIVLRLREFNFQTYLVGGAVRDLLQGEIPQDWDLATDALPEKIESLFPKTVPTGKRFGTITVIRGDHQAEITTLRTETGYRDRRKPDQVSFGTDLLSDLARRDFTINAIAYDFNTVQLIDPYDGRSDLKRGILKTVGNPETRFAEDGLRMFRFYRFLATLDLRPDRHTMGAINPEWAGSVSPERIRDEFSKLLLGKGVRQGLIGLRRSGLLEIFLPELHLDQSDHRQNPCPNLWEHLLSATETIHPILHLRLAALFHDIAKPLTAVVDQNGLHFYGHDEQGAILTSKIMERLRYPKSLIARVCSLVRWHMFNLTSQVNDAAIRRFIAKTGPEIIPDLLELRRADIVATGRIHSQTWEYWQDFTERITAILQEEPVISQANLAVDGRDLQTAFSLKAGPLIGEILRFLWDSIMENPELNQKSQLLNLAKKYLSSKCQKPENP